MKTTTIITTCLTIIMLNSAIAQPNVIDLELDVQKSNISVLDIDGDGHRDLLIVGENPDGRFAQLFQNDQNLTFSKVASPFVGAALTTVEWGDINGDGYLDAIQSGFGLDSIVSDLFLSDAQGQFSVDLTLINPVHMAPSCGMADLNNDGYTDLYIFGNHFEGRPQLFFNDTTGGFTLDTQFESYVFIDPQVSEVDIDNDGDLDLFVMAGYEQGIDARFARLFINDRGTFTEEDPQIIAKGFGHSEWGDYDSDGDLDLLLNGDGWVNSGEDNDHIYRLYQNTDGELQEVTTFTTYRQSNVGDGSRFADWDNDGDLDIVLTGWNQDAERQSTAIYVNDAGTFTAYEGNAILPGVSESALELGDLDNDGDLDLIIGGYSGNEWNGEGSAYNRNVSLIIENTLAGTNEAPAAPGGLVAEPEGPHVTFSWSAPADDKTSSESLTYNFFLIDEQGRHFYCPLADTATGFLIIQEKGNVQLNTSWTVYNLAYGTYQWGVQAIDNSFAGSLFTTANFTHREGGPLGLLPSNQSLVYPNPAQGSIKLDVPKDLQSIAVWTMDGKIIYQQEVESSEYLELRLPTGIYMVKASFAHGKQLTEKIIVR
ncbi:MAG: T9SS type A sorting domain-containing protein [Cyclobacteriaceae bacterium]|nr:T9SS type A sorting domain-containing protein [Cyclobacteriaceae bacterium HetDA_MAG_MS6]